MSSTFDEIRADLTAQQLAAEEQGARVAARYHELLLRVLREFRAQFFPRDPLFGPLVFHDRVLWGIGRHDPDQPHIVAPVTITLRLYDGGDDEYVYFYVGIPGYRGLDNEFSEEGLRQELPKTLQWLE